MSFKLIIYAVLFGAWSYFCYHEGGLPQKLKDATSLAKQEALAETKTASEATTINQEVQTHADAITAPPDPTPAVICVRKYAASGLPKTAATGPRVNGASDLSATADRPVQPITDIARPAAVIGQACDAQIAEAQAYIRDVCQK
jgi:hypothetical protein